MPLSSSSTPSPRPCYRRLTLRRPSSESPPVCCAKYYVQTRVCVWCLCASMCVLCLCVGVNICMSMYVYIYMHAYDVCFRECIYLLVHNNATHKHIHTYVLYVRICIFLSITGYNIQSKLHGVSNLHVTSLLLCNGYLWIGTSVGTIMVYRTPYLKTVPITTGKPYLALHSHAISTHTVGTLSSSRLDQFISEEQEQFQEDWETSETTEDSQVPLPTPSDSDIISVNGGGGASSTITLL